MIHSSSITAGLDLGDKYSYLCLLDTQSGEVIEEGRISTNPKKALQTEAFLQLRTDANRHRGRHPLAVD